MKYLLTQLNKPVRGAATIITVVTVGTGIITGIVAWTWNTTIGDLKENSIRVEARVDKTIDDVTLMKSDIAVIKEQNKTILETQKAMMVLLKK